MMTLRRDEQRRHVRHRDQDSWLTFWAQNRADPLAAGFGNLEILNEDRLPPGAGGGVQLPRHHDAEIVTYVREGALAYMRRAMRRGSACLGFDHVPIETRERARLLDEQLQDVRNELGGHADSLVAYLLPIRIACRVIIPWISLTGEGPRRPRFHRIDGLLLHVDAS